MVLPLATRSCRREQISLRSVAVNRGQAFQLVYEIVLPTGLGGIFNVPLHATAIVDELSQSEQCKGKWANRRRQHYPHHLFIYIDCSSSSSPKSSPFLHASRLSLNQFDKENLSLQAMVFAFKTHKSYILLKRRASD